MIDQLQNLQTPPAKMPALGIIGAHFLDARGRLPIDAMVISEGKIVAMGFPQGLQAQYPQAHWVDASGFVVHPGLINGHTHVAMSFMREMAHVSENMLEDVFFPLESRLSPELVEIFSYPSVIMGMRSGVTCFFDHYYHAESVGKTMDSLGVRGLLAETVNDLGGAMPGMKRFDAAQKLVESWPFSERLKPVLGPHAMDTVSDELAKKLSQLKNAYNLPVHMHLSQTQIERERVLKSWQMTPVERARDLGFLGTETLAVHLLSAKGSDWDILAEHGVFAGVCPSSQIFYEELVDLKALEGAGLKAILGTDCAASHDSMDQWTELRTYHLMRRQAHAAPISAEETLKAVWDHPAEWSGQKIGRLELGYEADLGFTPLSWDLAPVHDLRAHFVLSLGSRQLQHLMVAGEWVLWRQEPVRVSLKDWRQEYQEGVEQLRPYMKSKRILFPVMD